MKEKHLRWSEIHLDAMRGLAALIVAFGHGRGLFFPSFTSAPLFAQVVGRPYTEPTMEQLTIGHQAVMVFFVLSGYLVGGSVLKSFASDRWGWSDYLVKRNRYERPTSGRAKMWTARELGLTVDRLGGVVSREERRHGDRGSAS